MKLEFKHVTKRYGEVAAVREVSCVMEQGIYGLLGVNGAGKTTLMRMLCTIIQPSEGEILWDGKEIWKLGSDYREVLGYLPQEFGYYPDLSVYDYLMYISSIKGLKPAFANKRIKRLLKQVDMWKFSKRKMKQLSGGMVRRVGIAQAMLNDPKILVLDEPTAGLDPNERIRFRNLISELSEDRLVLLSTHIVSDIEYIANEGWIALLYRNCGSAACVHAGTSMAVSGAEKYGRELHAEISGRKCQNNRKWCRASNHIEGTANGASCADREESGRCIFALFRGEIGGTIGCLN